MALIFLAGDRVRFKDWDGWVYGTVERSARGDNDDVLVSWDDDLTAEVPARDLEMVEQGASL